MIHASLRTLCALAALSLTLLGLPTPASGEVVLSDYRPTIVAGDPGGTPTDTPALRVDPNTTTSPYAGVGSVQIVQGASVFLCSGAAISPYHILTAAHCLDLDNNGSLDVTPGNVTFRLNYGGNLTHAITASALSIHPDWTGFNNPSGNVHDDLAILTLSSPLPAGVPIYSLLTTPVTTGTTLTMVGYGVSGSGTGGYSGGPSFSVKRVGRNNADAFELDDEGSGQRELYEFDFDGPTSATNFLGGLTLGNNVETTLGSGDSGGPAFVDLGGGQLRLAGNTTFTARFTLPGNQLGPAAPLFGSAGGGVLLYPYLDYIAAIVSVPEAGSVVMISASFSLFALGKVSRLRRKRR
jgi:secreted trypsin-like serine protease